MIIYNGYGERIHENEAKDGRGVDLSRLDLTGANLEGMDLRGADLSRSSLYGASLRSAGLQGAYLMNSDLRYATLSCASLHGANLMRANLRGASLRFTILHGANLRGADLSGTDLTNADFRGCNLSDVNFSKTVMNTCDFEGAKLPVQRLDGLMQAGRIVYKTFGMYYDPEPEWIIKKGSLIRTDMLDTSRAKDCGTGINVATPEWIVQRNSDKLDVWECFVPPDAEICVPLNTDGKFRVSQLVLVRKYSAGSFARKFKAKKTKS